MVTLFDPDLVWAAIRNALAVGAVAYTILLVACPVMEATNNRRYKRRFLMRSSHHRVWALIGWCAGPSLLIILVAIEYAAYPWLSALYALFALACMFPAGLYLDIAFRHDLNRFQQPGPI